MSQICKTHKAHFLLVKIGGLTISNDYTKCKRLLEQAFMPQAIPKHGFTVYDWWFYLGTFSWGTLIWKITHSFSIVHNDNPQYASVAEKCRPNTIGK